MSRNEKQKNAHKKMSKMYTREELTEIFASAKDLYELDMLLDTFIWLIKTGHMEKNNDLYEVASSFYKKLTI